VRQIVRSLAPRALETNASRFAEELQALALRRITPFPNGIILPPHKHEHHHAHERDFAAIQVPLPFLVRKHELETLLDSLPDRVLRVKGWCRIEEFPQFPMSLQHVRPKGKTTFFPMLSAMAAEPVAVVIGVQLPVNRIRAQFAALPSAERAPGYVPYAL
jgi:G3E family GTPase